MQRSCLVLFSGGLDSILACKVLQEQGIDVIGIKFITPFFSYQLRDEQEAQRYREQVLQKYGIRLEIADITKEYLKMVTRPSHGYGRYLNPCIDCKILMVKKATSLMESYGASFIATGEVLGQRPMSQRRDTLRIIERDSGAEGLLLRPLSAQSLKETIPETQGVVDRLRLPAITGRSRKEQIRLAERFGINDYPAPAGGCVLADPILSKRFRRVFERWPDFTAKECVLAQTGRHFLLPGGSWLVVGRNKAENAVLEGLLEKGDVVLKARECAGPLCILRRMGAREDVKFSAAICARYAKKKELPITVGVARVMGHEETVEVRRIPSDEEIQGMMF